MILDDSRLTPEQMQEYADGLAQAIKIIDKFLPDSRVDGSSAGGPGAVRSSASAT